MSSTEMRPPKSQRQLALGHQLGALRSQYPGSRAVKTQTDLVWVGELTPTDFSPTYEVLLAHRLGSRPLVYVVRPHLVLVTGKRLPHVYLHNLLCLHTTSNTEVGSNLLSRTVVPWTKEWLYYYEVWLATGGEWLGGGEHPRLPPSSPSHPGLSALKGTARVAQGARVESGKGESPEDEDLTRLKNALRVMYQPSDDRLRDLLYNARLIP